MRPDIAVPGSGNTTHFSVVDRFGNAVANTYSLNFNYGLGLVAEGTGIMLNNELDDFAAKPGAPNAFGLVGGAANAPGPGQAAAVIDDPDDRVQGRQSRCWSPARPAAAASSPPCCR